MDLVKLRTFYLMGRLPSKDLQVFILNSNTDHIKKCYELTIGQTSHLPPIQFRRKWITFILKQLHTRKGESQQQSYDDEDEYSDLAAVTDEWYNALAYLSTADPQTEPFYRFYGVQETESYVKMYENEDAFVSNGTTGLITWEASIHLAKYFASDPHILDSVNWMIELGSGCGYVAIATVKLAKQSKGSPIKYYATDGSLEALSKCQTNISANFGQDPTDDTKCPISLLKVDWTKAEDIKEFVTCVEGATRQHGTGCLVGADLIFDPELIPSLVHLFSTFLSIQASHSYPGKVILSSETRNGTTSETLTIELGTLRRNVDLTRSWSNGKIITIT